MQDPAVGFFFLVEFNGIDDLGANDFRFQEVSGLNSELGVEELKEGGENRFAHRLPNPAKYSNLVLKRGLVTRTALIDWFRNAIENFEFDPITVRVTLLNASTEPLLNWNFVGAYPVKWSVSNLNAEKNEVMIDTIELAYKYFTKST
ncbi:phage tail protein [Fodinibius salsisoli]|uniref:Phage tail protein n=1 Tax=Fodinibius salsisoli TaxID=2820877 RepID=A0ABT3PQL5_9BACT|nr:phage tail protein [Fodinibius salsisoli]MCW9708157.1 phage tail protein [Fodinibius salsisoli]